MKFLPSSYFNKNESLGNTTELLGSVMPLKTARACILEGAKTSLTSSTQKCSTENQHKHHEFRQKISSDIPNRSDLDSSHLRNLITAFWLDISMGLNNYIFLFLIFSCLTLFESGQLPASQHSWQ